MTTAPARPIAARPVSVETVGVDELRATVQVNGPLSSATVPLLVSVLEAHERAGRRYLRVDLAGGQLDGQGVLEPLRSRHAALADAGGLLVFDNAGEVSAALLRRGDLFVTPAPVQLR